MQTQSLSLPSGDPNLEFMYRCLIDIAVGMDYLHSLGVINGDLKPANVLLKSTNADARGFTCKVPLQHRSQMQRNRRLLSASHARLGMPLRAAILRTALHDTKELLPPVAA